MSFATDLFKLVNMVPLDNAASGEKKAQILKQIEDIGNRDVDSPHSPRILLEYLASQDPEVLVSALQASGTYVSDIELFEEVFRLAQEHEHEEVRGMAASTLGNLIHDGLGYEEDVPDEIELSVPGVNPEFYYRVKEFLLSRVDALMESMEVRRRILESLGYLAWKPEIHELILRFYHQAPNPWVKVSALYAMGLVRDPIFERIILEELFNENESILIEAAHAAHTLELYAAEQRLWELVHHPSLDVRCECVVALGVLGDLTLLPDLLSQMESEDRDLEEMTLAVEQARAMVKQRSMLEQGDDLWDDNRVLSEIDEMLENPGNIPE